MALSSNLTMLFLPPAANPPRYSERNKIINAYRNTLFLLVLLLPHHVMGVDVAAIYKKERDIFVADSLKIEASKRGSISVSPSDRSSFAWNPTGFSFRNCFAG